MSNTNTNNGIPSIDDLTPEQIEALRERLPPAPAKAKGRKALISDATLMEIHAKSTSNLDFGRRLLGVTLSNGSTGFDHWSKDGKQSREDAAADAARSMAVRISKLRKDHPEIQTFASGRRKDPETAQRRAQEAFDALDADQRKVFLVANGLTVSVPSEG